MYLRPHGIFLQWKLFSKKEIIQALQLVLRILRFQKLATTDIIVQRIQALKKELKTILESEFSGSFVNLLWILKSLIFLIQNFNEKLYFFHTPKLLMREKSIIYKPVYIPYLQHNKDVRIYVMEICKKIRSPEF